MTASAPWVTRGQCHPDLLELESLAPQHIPSYRNPEALALLDEVCDYLDATDRDSWWEGPTFRSPCGTKHCVLSHVFEQMGERGFENFEYHWSTSYVIGARVNDTASPDYPQSHPKDRVMAYLNDLRQGFTLDTESSIEIQYLHDPDNAGATS